MKINVLLFGSLTEIIGQSSISLSADKITDVHQLHAYLLKQYPALSAKTFKYAVNQDLVDTDHTLQEGDEVALLPPFSGG
ncbi:molybdopterin converting factor subunit 1 [Rhodocytophaga rosea]|uniref:Molybdopterin synthase sulfur carrier subunit n=1 Tax=Rhodocytophaga rosea TaxID=2704465 RepID=A0A6C0GFS1_9BACT|nr:molybdopterin converting factor subunit 1 [Rhodocytophaga rosea]QHT66715.1 molybdopterin converting factor subunit 1 [Rhodocytophaga rosea]